jgi:hypothetical protein
MALATAAVAVEGRSSETASKIARKGSFDVIRFMVATPGSGSPAGESNAR